MEAVNAFYRFAEPSSRLEERITLAVVIALTLLNIAVVVWERRRRK
jgi:hypothetical protein